MTPSYHTSSDELKAGRPQDRPSFHEPKAEASSPPARITATFISQTGEMPHVQQDEDEPLHDRDDATRRGAYAPQPTRKASMSANDPVLIVEDTVELAEVIEATVQGMGLPAVVANHGSIALEHLAALSPCLLLLDLGLPDINGWEILRTIKDLYRAQNRAVPPIIVITAYGDPANRLVGKFQEVNAYLIKPFTPDQIEQTISAVLNAAR